MRLETPLVGSHMDALYPEILNHVLRNGEEVSPRGQLTKEVRPLMFTLTDPLNRFVTLPERKANYAFGLIEALQFMGGTTSGAQQIRYNSNIKNWVDPESGQIEAAYGVLARDQVPYVIDTLTGDPDSRQAVISIYGGIAHQKPMLNVPCTCTLQFFIREGAVELVVYMRSNDLWWGTPYDVFQFTAMQELVACALGLPMGKYTHIAGSSHIYAPFFGKARNLVINSWQRGNIEHAQQQPLLPIPRVPLGALRDVARTTLLRETQEYGDEAEQVRAAFMWGLSDPYICDPFTGHLDTLRQYQDNKIARRK